jgi:alkanesulfonate monooxygenase SsuD/methylene tetrahydromethanopterin reductase-like flavin-dependent oxidoreductase (luciferase family)
MAGGVADGVFLRVGTHPANIATAVEAVRAGAAAAGRDAAAVRLGLVIHTILVEARDRALRMARSMAAGFYEYSPALFRPPGLSWDGPEPETLKRRHQIWPDFHHAPDLEASGGVVEFLPVSAAHAFSLHGGPDEVTGQLVDLLRAAPAEFDHVVLHPIPDPVPPEDPERGYMARMAREVLPQARRLLGEAR